MIQSLRRVIVILVPCGWAYDWNIANSWRFFVGGAVSLQIFENTTLGI